MMRLIDEAEVDTRLKAASNRLEAFEDLMKAPTTASPTIAGT